ncbi:sensor histidine kinase [Streptomyces sp. NBC_01304]|uniref:sensor histidine kinase n=1 Tax=Streptomyces sp. NBC_01304 TaxID=2903818 RepID=UPI002E1046B9|nr:sensor domain-containing protein [Streptomyces sp. NBC_01304]
MKEAIRRAGRATLHLTVGAGLSFACYILFGLILVGLAATMLVVGAGMLPETVQTVRRFAGFERRRTAAWSGAPVPEAYLPLTGPLAERIRHATTDPGTYRDLRWVAAQLVYGLVLFYVALVGWVPALLVDGIWSGLLRREPVALPLFTRLVDLEATWSRALLLPSPGMTLATRVEQLTATRAGAIAAHGAELRRIERDLHDGAQAHLVALSMRIGLARRAYDRDPSAARRLLDEAQDQAEEALAELRHVVRGIHPPVLTDRGLAGAVRALAASSGLDVNVLSSEGLAVEDNGGARAPAAVEAAAYFVVAEALTNAAKHSGSERVSIALTQAPKGLSLSVRDEGRGGADESAGSGLLGIRRRVAALDGTVALTSPVGGPTVIDVELPCVW